MPKVHGTTKKGMDKAKRLEQKLKNKINTLNKRLSKVQRPILIELRNQKTQLTAIRYWIKTHKVKVVKKNKRKK